MITYCDNEPCETEAVTERNESNYCYTCAEAFDRGYDQGTTEDEKEIAGAPRELLRRAADKLQDYCAAANGDLNDRLATEIYTVLGD